MRRWLLALLLTAGGTPLAAAADVIPIIDSCIHRLDPALDVGYERVAARCPELAPALAASPYAAWLPSDWNRADNALSVGGLAELRTLLARRAAVPAVRAPQIARLPGVLARLQRQDAAQRSWWERFEDWLHELFAPETQRADGSWLQRLWRSFNVSPSAQQLMVWGSLVVLLALALAIVLNELRVAGLLRRRARRTARAAPARQAGAGELSWADIEQAAPSQQLPLLLQLITARLSALQRLPAARALTVHELERAAQLPAPEDRAHLAALLQACEYARFAARAPPPALLAAAVAHGQQLLSALAPLPAAARPR